MDYTKIMKQIGFLEAIAQESKFEGGLEALEIIENEILAHQAQYLKRND